MQKYVFHRKITNQDSLNGLWSKIWEPALAILIAMLLFITLLYFTSDQAYKKCEILHSPTYNCNQ